MKHFVLGADIGGTHITTAIVDLDKKSILPDTWNRILVDSGGSADQIIEGWADCMLRTMACCEQRIDQIKIAMPGPMDYENGISMIQDQVKFRAMFGLQITKLLADRLEFNEQDIALFNDAACFLKGELFGGTIDRHEQVIGITLGTGLGSAYSSGGEAIDADLWKMPLFEGIAEDYLSTGWFVRRFDELAGIQVTGVKELIDNHLSSAYFSVIFSEFSRNMATFFQEFIKQEAASAAVIGGSIAHANPYFLDQTQACLSERLGYDFPIFISNLGERAALIGAAASFRPVKSRVTAFP